MKHPPKAERKPERRKGILWGSLLTGLLIIAVLAVVWIVPAVIGKHQQRKLTIPESVDPVRSLPEKTVETIEIMNPDGESYLLVAQGEQLLLSRDGSLLPISSEASKEFLDIFSHFTVQATISESSEELPLAEMGLSPAQSSAHAYYTDGSELLAELGNAIPETGFYYLKWNLDDGIYAVDEGMKTAFEKSADRLLPVSQPSMAAELVESLEISNPNGTFSIRIATDEEGISSGRLMQPWVYPLSNESLSALQNALSSFRLGSVLSEVDDRNAHEYGLSPSRCTLTVHQGEGLRTDTGEDGALILLPQAAADYTIELGDEIREHFYPCRYLGQYYLVSKYLVQSLVHFSAQDAVTKKPFHIGDSSISRIFLQYGEETRELIAEYREELPDDPSDPQGDIRYTAAYTLNGEALSQTQMEMIVDFLSGITVSGELPSDWEPGGEALWTLSITSLSGEERVLAAYPLDPFFSALSVDGVFLHRISSETIDRLLEMLTVHSVSGRNMSFFF